MRRAKRELWFAPYTRGMVTGYAAALIFAALGAAFLLATDSVQLLAGAVATVTFAVGGFASGRAGGAVSRRDGLKTGALCGALYMLPLALLSLIMGLMSGGMLLIKLLLCMVFGSAGGVVGVNRSDS